MPYDLSADVFSFGMVMLEIITRQRIDKVCNRGPADFFAVVPERIRESGIIPKDAPEKLLALAFACTVYEAKERPTFPQLLSALSEILAGIPSRHRSNAMRSPLAPPTGEKRPEGAAAKRRQESRPAAASSPAPSSAAIEIKSREGATTVATELPPLDMAISSAAVRAASSNVLTKGKSPRKGVQDLFQGPESPK